MSLNFLILKLLTYSILPVLPSLEVSVKLEGQRKVDAIQRSYYVSVFPLPTNFALATWHGRELTEVSVLPVP